MDTVISQALVDIIKHEVNDSKEIFFAKGREFDNTVKAVHEFRAEEISKLVKHRIGTIFTGSSKANASFNFTCTSIWSHDDDGILETYSSPLTISQATVVKNLEEHVKNVWVSFFNLIQKNEWIWITADFFS